MSLDEECIDTVTDILIRVKYKGLKLKKLILINFAMLFRQANQKTGVPD